MQIRKLAERDLEQTAALEKECFGASAWSLESFRKTLTDVNALYLVAVEEETVLGCCGLWQSFEDGEIMNVMVRPDSRRNGCAAALLQECMRLGRECGMENFTLEVREGNLPAISLYQSCGFESVGVRKNFYDNPKENALIMWKYQNRETHLL